MKKQICLINAAYTEALYNAKPILYKWYDIMENLKFFSESMTKFNNNTLADLIIDIYLADCLFDIESDLYVCDNSESEIVINGLYRVLKNHIISNTTANGHRDIDEHTALKHLCRNCKIYTVTEYLNKMIADLDEYLQIVSEENSISNTSHKYST